MRLQDTIGENNYLKIQIDIMRKEILFAKDNIRTMNDQIQELRDKSTKAQQKSSHYSKQTADSNNWILSLKAKSEASKIQFENQVKQLQGKLQERQDQNEVREEDMDKSKNEKGKFDNPTAILNIRLENITAQNKEKKRLLDLYMRNAQVIEQAFQVMREGSGINSTDEIVTSFIKAEEQQYALWNYQNQLTQEVDGYEERIRAQDSEIKMYKERAKLTNEQLDVKVKEMTEEAELLKKQILLESEQVQEV